MVCLVGDIVDDSGVVDVRGELIEETLVDCNPNSVEGIAENVQCAVRVDIGNDRDDVIKEFRSIMGVFEQAVAYQEEEL